MIAQDVVDVLDVLVGVGRALARARSRMPARPDRSPARASPPPRGSCRRTPTTASDTGAYPARYRSTACLSRSCAPPPALPDSPTPPANTTIASAALGGAFSFSGSRAPPDQVRLKHQQVDSGDGEHRPSRRASGRGGRRAAARRPSAGSVAARRSMPSSISVCIDRNPARPAVGCATSMRRAMSSGDDRCGAASTLACGKRRRHRSPTATMSP